MSTAEILPVGLLALACTGAVVVLYRPLMLSSVMPEVAEAKGVHSHRMGSAFLVVIALATAMTVPVVGALLIFSLMIGPPAAARSLTARPLLAIVLSVALALLTVWAAIAGSYLTNWPVGFYVGMLGALCYALGRGVAGWRRLRSSRRVTASGVPASGVRA